MSEATVKPVMPKFKLAKSEIQTDDVLNAALDAEKGGKNDYFEPGHYDVVIDEVEYMGPAKNDTTWGNFKVTLKGTGEKSINSYILVPFQDYRYGEKKSLFPYRNLKSFCDAIGVTLSTKDIDTTLQTVFGQPEKLKGTSVSIDVGYQKGYVKYHGKTSEGGQKYCLHTRDGNVVCSDLTKQPIVFADRAAAINYAADNGIAIDKYVNVLSYAPSAAGVGFKAGGSNW
jgi:hypothetical protein